jgi:hypothetical protein
MHVLYPPARRENASPPRRARSERRRGERGRRVTDAGLSTSGGGYGSAVRRAAIASLVLVVGIALLVGLHPVSSARTSDDYRHKAKDTAESVLSSVQTARLAARVATRGDAFGPFVSVVLSESDTAVDNAQRVFEGVQPPDTRSDAVRARLGRLTSASGDVVSRLRITARRGELGRLERRARPLRDLATALRRFIEKPGAS